MRSLKEIVEQNKEAVKQGVDLSLKDNKGKASAKNDVNKKEK